MNCLHSFRTKNKLELHKRVCENKDFCDIGMLSEDTKILEFNKYQKSHKALFISYVDLEYLIEKISEYKNNPEKSPATTVGGHIPSGFSMYATSSLKDIKNKHDVYRGKDCMKKFCESLKEHAMKIIKFKKKK